MKANNRANMLNIFFSVYGAAIIIQNVLAAKQFDLWAFTVTTGILVSPIVFIAQDVVSETYGYKTARKMILCGFAMQFIGALLYTLAINIQPSQFWANQDAFAAVLGTTFRISVASFTAYIVGSLVNSKVMVRLKEHSPLFVRAIVSTIFGQGLDNTLFAVIAFTGILPVPAIVSMIVGGTIFETVYEVFFYPVTKAIIGYVNGLDK